MKKNDFIFAGSLAIVFFIGLFLLLSQQETDGKRKPEPAPTATPEPSGGGGLPHKINRRTRNENI